MNEPISEIFVLIAEYAHRQGWIPIGWREFSIGPWDITVNGTKERRDDLDPYHARIVHRDIVAILILSPFGGGVGGWGGAEEALIKDLKSALEVA